MGSHYLEKLSWFDSIYLSILSITTVGYGDHSFKSWGGRVFASVWLLVSILAGARACLYLAELIIDWVHRKIALWKLGQDLMLEDSSVDAAEYGR